MVKNNKKLESIGHTKFFSAIGALLIMPLLLVGVYFLTRNTNNYSYKSSAKEAPTEVPAAPEVGTSTGLVSNTGAAPKYNCGALCDRVFKIPENKVKCINPCNKVGDKKAEGMECRDACDKSIVNGQRLKFCYKFCPAIEVGTP
ncbi:MAG: hypothetical protein UR68_C0028G0002 [Candidatus Roizmanbacteria bacterium GW2011_GWA2_35_19]|uniref:Uncharacterized protein n=1 Tax=Candidatus Roizmanbacteria bacterium GW2011_GWA2_35_19 TaxID=1618478 RepID=A0A0G0E8N0_9BACT|nr:MAG: hypothetical protein UR68_C0028G0002 [Candidatus Roizmanbacteria bacterium GW2011_GWA2_35_19]